MNQVKTTEIAYSGPDLYHKLFHRSYRRWATDHIYSKQTNRAWVMGAVREQKHMAEEIDSAYTKRFEAELANMLDRQVDIEWETTNVAGFTFGGMGEKIRKQQQRFKQYIQPTVQAVYSAYQLLGRLSRGFRVLDWYLQLHQRRY